MKRKVLSILLTLVLVCSFSLVTAAPAAANTGPSSTMIFEGTLTDEGGGVYSGIIPMVDEFATNLGDQEAGFDIFAREGATAWFGDDPSTDPVWTSVAIDADHDAWPSFAPDTWDWYQYSLNLYVKDGVQKWAVRNHAGATEPNPWSSNPATYPARGVPMSGIMDWDAMYATETDTGAYLDGTGTPEIPGGAAAHGGGAACFDMDWSWGSEAVPLQYAGFAVTVAPADGGYRVTMAPGATASVGMTTQVGDLVAISVTPGSIDFGSIVPGADFTGNDINVTNTGNVHIDVSAELLDKTIDSFYSSYLKLNGQGPSLAPPYRWDADSTGLNLEDMAYVPEIVTTALVGIPADETPGPRVDTLVFWAEKH